VVLHQEQYQPPHVWWAVASAVQLQMAWGVQAGVGVGVLVSIGAGAPADGRVATALDVASREPAGLATGPGSSAEVSVATGVGMPRRPPHPKTISTTAHIDSNDLTIIQQPNHRLIVAYPSRMHRARAAQSHHTLSVSGPPVGFSAGDT
jgi:hypothetical protein